MKMKRSMRYIAVVTVIMAFLSGCSSREGIECERVDASVSFEKASRGEFKPLKAVGYVYSGSGKNSLFDGNKMIVCQILENGRVIVSIDGNRSMRRMNTMAQMGLEQVVEMTASDEIQQLKRMAYVFLEEGIDTDEIESGDPLPDGVYVYAGLEEMTAVDGEALKLRKFIALSGKDKEKAMRNYVEACRKAEAERQAAKEAAEEAERQQVLEERRRRQTELEMAQKKTPRLRKDYCRSWIWMCAQKSSFILHCETWGLPLRFHRLLNDIGMLKNAGGA